MKELLQLTSKTDRTRKIKFDKQKTPKVIDELIKLLERLKG
jgi:hypothetical protein